MALDFQENLLKYLQTINKDTRIDFMDDSESVVMYSLPGAKVVQAFMDNTKVMAMPYIIMIKRKDQAEANEIAWLISEKLSAPDLMIESKNHSFQFLELTHERPFVSEKNQAEDYIYMIDIVVKLEIKER